MALNVTQVNQAFLGLLGRPATGAEAAKFAGLSDTAALAQTLLTDASFKNQLSVETLSFKTVDLQNTDQAAFVESLYTALLGRASDAEGKAFWLSVAAATPNRADVVAQFIAAVKAQNGTADANAFATIQAEDKALANAWVESLYNNLAGRASDPEGLEFWTNAIINFTLTPAQVAAEFANALALQGDTTEDGKNYLAKQGVAKDFTDSFKDFNALVTANEKAEQLNNLVTLMNGVNKDSQVDQYKEEIAKNVNEFQNIKAIQFTTSNEDELGIDPETGESNLKVAANFTGTYNLTDPEKGTIQSSDSATGTEDNLTDTLTVNVTGYDKTTHANFDLGELPNTTSVEKLVINNGAANINDGNDYIGSINGDFEYINVNGTGSFKISASTSSKDGFKDISLKSAAKTDNIFTAADKVASFKSAAGNDTIILGEVSKSLSTGAGNDKVEATLGKNATADLGAGNDTFTGYLGEAAKLNAGAGNDTLYVTGADRGNKAEIKIDGGTGTDTLDLSKGFANEFRGIESIKGIEKVVVGNGTTLYATAVSGQKLELSGDTGSNLVLDAKGASTVDLTKFTNADGSDIAVRVENIKSGNVNLESGTKNFNAIKETISIAKDASKVSIKGFEKGNDHIEIEGATATTANLLSKSGDKIIINQDAEANSIYFVSTKEKLTITDLNKYLANNDANAKFTNLKEKDVFYIVATDSVNPVDGSKPGSSSTAKIIKVEVGKDGKVGKVDQVATVNVADRAQLSAADFVGANTPAIPENTEHISTAGKTVSAGELDLSDLKLDKSDTKYFIDLSSNPDVANITSVKLPAGINAGSVILRSLDETKVPNGTVEVTIPADAKMGGFSAGVWTDTYAGQIIGEHNDTVNYNVTVTEGAKVNIIATNNGSNTVKAAEGVQTIWTASGDDTIDITGTTTATLIDGGEGADTLKISDTSADKLIAMAGIDRIEFNGTSINADAIVTNAKGAAGAITGATTKGVTKLDIATMNTDKKELEIKVGAKNEIDLSSLAQATDDSGDASLKITGVKNGNVITLTTNADATRKFVETVELGKATKVTIANANKGDNISSENFAETVVGENGKFADLAAGNITATKAYFVNPENVADVTDFATAKKTFEAKLADFKNGDAIIAVNGANEKVYVFAIKGAANGATATEVVTVNGKFDANYGIRDGVITIADTAPIPEPTSGELRATLLEGTASDYELTVVNPPVSIDKAGTILKLASDKVTTLKAADAISLTVEATSEKAAKLSFNEAVKNSEKIELVELKGTGTRTVDLANVNAKAVKNITDGAADTTLDISGKTFGVAPGNANQFANGLKIDLGAGNADVVVLGGAIAANAFTLANVEGIKTSGASVSVESGLLDTVSGTTSTANAYSLDGNLTVKKFAQGTTEIDFSKITKANDQAKLTLDLVNGAVVNVNGLTSVKGSAAHDTLVVSGSYTVLDTIEGIDAITLGSNNDTTLKAAAITGDKLAINGAHKLTVDANGAANVDLAKLSKGTGTPTIEIQNVGQGTQSGATIALNKDDGIAETIKVVAGAKGDNAVTITGFAAGAARAAEDKIDFSAIVAALAGTSANTLKDISSATGTTNAKANTLVYTGEKDVGALEKDDLSASIGKAANEVAGSKAVLFVSKADEEAKTGVYLVTGASGATDIASVELIATINGADIVQDTWKVAAGVLELA